MLRRHRSTLLWIAALGAWAGGCARTHAGWTPDPSPVGQAAEPVLQGTRPSKRVSTARVVEPPVAAQPPVKAGAEVSAGDVAGAGERTLREADLKGLSWRSIGPANMGGRVADVALAPGNPKTFFVAFATGGLFKTTNQGTTFTPVMDQACTASIGSVVVADAPPDWPGWEKEDRNDGGDPVPAAERAEKGQGKIVWVGTGEGNGRNSSSWGCGVFRSTDGGDTFEPVGLSDAWDIPRLAVDPRDPDICYAAALGHLWGPNAERGVYKTRDGGGTWEPVLRIDEHTGACDVLLDPQNPDIVYAAMYARRRTAYSFQGSSERGGIFRSLDAGANWTKLSGGLPRRTGRIGLELYRADPRVLFAVVESDEGGWGVGPFDDRSKAGGVFRSDDRGETWMRLNGRSPRSFYFSKIRVDPNDANRVYRLGWGLDISDDGGKHFRAGGARHLHPDVHALVIDPDDPEHLLLGTDGGVYVSYDRGKTWDFLNHLAVGEFYNIAVDLSDPYRVAGGLQDNGTWVGPSAGRRSSGGDALGDPDANTGITNQDWFFITNGDGFHVAFDPRDPNVLYSEMQGGRLMRTHLDTGRRRLIHPAPQEGEPAYRFNWNAPFFISPHDPSTLYLGGNYVFKLTKGGDRWARISPDLSRRDVDRILAAGSQAETYGTVVALAESPVAAGVLWAGTDDGLIHLSTDDGRNWKDVTPPEVDGRYVAGLEPSPHDRRTAYAAIDGHRSDRVDPLVLMTVDEGRSWRSITGNLPAGAPVKVVRADLENPDVLFAGTERAAYATIDRGDHWVKLNGKTLPTVAVDDLVIHPRERDLVAGTHGRSIYILDDITPLEQLTPLLLQKPLHVFKVPAVKPRLLLPYSGLWGDRMFKAKNPPLGARITYWLRDYAGEEVSLTIEDAHGVKVRKLSGTNRPGLNRVVWDLQREKYDRFSNPDAWLRQTVFVPPGTYTVRVSCGKLHAETTLEMPPAPTKPD